MGPKLSIEFINEVVDKKDNKVKFYKRGDKYLYWHRIYAHGTEEELNKIKEITYILHPTFQNPVRKTSDKSNNFELITWAWGEFTMKIIITTKDGEEYYRDFEFKLGEPLRKAKEKKDVIFEKGG
jgi:transcription initiation factor IIF auxiliary subunit